MNPHRTPLPEIPDGAIRPLIVDGYAGSRLGLGVLLQREPWVGRCLFAADVQKGAELVRRHRPEVTLLDVSDAGPFMASAVEALHDAHPAMPIVLTSRCASGPSAPPHELGAADFLPPDAPPRKIVAAVRRAITSLDTEKRVRSTRSSEHLTDRERQLLALISTGATNREIASRLHLGPDSVKKNASTLYRKLGVRNRTEAAQHASEWLAPA